MFFDGPTSFITNENFDRATCTQELLGNDYTVAYIEGRWTVINDFRNGYGVILDTFEVNHLLPKISMKSVNITVYENADPTNSKYRVIEKVAIDDVSKTVDQIHEETDELANKAAGIPKEECKEDDVKSCHIALDVNEKVTFEDFSGNRVTVCKTATEYGTNKYSVYIEGYADIIADIAGSDPEGKAVERANHNDDMNEGKRFCDPAYALGMSRNIITFGDETQDYGGGLYGGGIAILKDRTTRNYIVSIVGDVDIYRKDKEVDDTKGKVTWRMK